MKYIPNILSVLRVFLAASLLFLYSRPGLFVAVYLATGFTDIADGFLARKYKLESTLGAKLDSAGDFAFWVVILYLLFFKARIFAGGLVLLMIVGTSITRLVNLLITRLKFCQWAMMHTLANKLAGLLLFFCMPPLLFIPALPTALVAAVGGLAWLAALEESAILMLASHYNINQKGIWELQKK